MCVCVSARVYQRNPICFSAIFHSLALSVDASGFSVSFSVFRCLRQIKSAARQVVINNNNKNKHKNTKTTTIITLAMLATHGNGSEADKRDSKKLY